MTLEEYTAPRQRPRDEPDALGSCRALPPRQHAALTLTLTLTLTYPTNPDLTQPAERRGRACPCPCLLEARQLLQRPNATRRIDGEEAAARARRSTAAAAHEIRARGGSLRGVHTRQQTSKPSEAVQAAPSLDNIVRLVLAAQGRGVCAFSVRSRRVQAFTRRRRSVRRLEAGGCALKGCRGPTGTRALAFSTCMKCGQQP